MTRPPSPAGAADPRSAAAPESSLIPAAEPLRAGGGDLTMRECERLRTLLNCTSEFIAVLDEAGTVTCATEPARILFGYPAHHLIGRSGLGLLHPEDTGRARAAFARLVSGVSTLERETVRCHHATGEWRWISLSATNHLGDPALRGIVVAFRDVTEQWQARGAAHETEELYRATFEHAPVGIAHARIDGRFLRVNGQYARMLGYTPAELLVCSLDQVTPPEELALDQQAFAELVAGTTPVHNRQKRYRAKDGRTVWGSLTVSLLRDDAGHPQYFIGVVEDITERKAIEQQLLHSQKMEAFGQLAGGVAHDFNNLLAVLLMHLNLMAVDPALPPKTVATLKQLEEATDRASSLVRQLLIFSRRQEISRRTLDLNHSVEGMCKMLRRFLGENIAFQFTPAAEPVWVDADAGMLEQVVMNLCVNARDAMPHGGRLTVAVAREHRAHCPASPPADHGCLLVTDTGHGMDEATRKRIFEPYFTTKPEGRGTGLGLSIVHGVAAQHGGWVEVESAPGAGSTFRVYLPLRPPAVIADLQEAPPLPRGTERILLVEDEVTVRATTATCLRYLGYEVTEAPDGPEAMARWFEADAPFDLVLTDMIMPGGLSGAELADELQRGRRDLKVLIMSGYDPEPGRTQQPGCRPWARLAKPFTAASLLQAVRAALDEPVAVGA